MIKELIKELAYDEIKLSQALTRSKIIAIKLKNDTFIQWLKKELEGYDINDPILPPYRKVGVILKLTFYSSNSNSTIAIPMITETVGAELADALQFHQMTEPIAIVENLVLSTENGVAHYELSPEQAVAILFIDEKQFARYRNYLRGGYKEFGVDKLELIIELTKQKLLDILLNLDSEFPDLINEFPMNKDDTDKVKNIITTNIYGNNNPLNIASGINVEQHNISNGLSTEDEDKLKSFGVSSEEIDELKGILESHSGDKPSLISKSMKWLGGVTSSVAGRGLYESIPAITDFIHKLTM